MDQGCGKGQALDFLRWFAILDVRVLLICLRFFFHIFPEQMYKQGQDRGAAPDVFETFHQRRLAAIFFSICDATASSSLHFAHICHRLDTYHTVYHR